MELRTVYRTLIIALALCAVGGGLAPVGALAMSDKMAASAKASKKTVFVCAECKEYFLPSAAKKMGFKDSMGHKLVKRHGIPEGYSNGDKMKDDKMKDDKMKDDKMKDDKT